MREDHDLVCSTNLSQGDYTNTPFIDRSFFTATIALSHSPTL